MRARSQSKEYSVSDSALVYSVDQGFLPLACMSIASIVENRTGPLPPVSILLHDVEAKYRLDAENFLARTNIEFDLVEVDGSWCEPWASARQQSQAKFGILRFSELLRTPAERVLIIDADTRFVDDIAPLLEMSLDGNVLAAADDIAVLADGRAPVLANKLGLPPGTGYFNSGLLIVDTNRWVAEEVGPKSVEILKNRTEILTFNDQCALNAVLQGQYTRLKYRWNHLVGSSPGHWPVSMYHYAGRLKPWRLRAARYFPFLRNLVPTEHFEYYQRMIAELEWSTPPFGLNGPIQAIGVYWRLRKLYASGRIRAYHERQKSPHLVHAAAEHPELLE